MTNRELLELAAKAAGLELDWDVPDGASPWVITGEGSDRGPAGPWDPLDDDGDALRLAVMLKLDIDCFDAWTIVRSSKAHQICEHGAQPSPTRRAIVRAAAAMASNGETV